ncbi:MAG: hypothetical protein J6J86_04820 [Lachnospiraceae bacterium]|nr:hypothetical protein [Lachnospiraceae bacterium]
MLARIKDVMRMTAAEKSIPLTDEDINVLAESITEDIEMLGKARFVKIEDLKPFKQPSFDDVIIEMKKRENQR